MKSERQKSTHDRSTSAPTRRIVLQMAGATTLAGTFALANVGDSAAATVDGARRGGPAPWRIDVHHHAMPPAIRAWLIAHHLLPPVGGPPFSIWDLNTTLSVMNANRIAYALLSAAIPSAFTATEGEARELAQIANAALAEVTVQEPSKFGFFAYAPLPYVDVALDQVTYALDHQGAAGVILMAHAGSTYLGDPAFDPFFAEMDRRHAVILVHPTDLPTGGGTPATIPSFLADYLLDTTRAGLNMILSGTLDRFPNLRIILPHGGGFLPYMGGRITLATYLGSGTSAENVRTSLQRFYYDTAMWTSPYATPTLLAAAGPSHLLYGSDWNAVPAAGIAAGAQALDDDWLLGPALAQAVNHRNATALFPDLAKTLRF